jgi:perosamine synthetase
LWAAGIGQGDEVVVTPYSFVASASVVLEVGATPVFADIEPDGFTMDPVAFEAAISTRTRAVIPVHQCGFPCDMTAIRSVAAAHRITVIEDAAAAHGARVDDAFVGTLGDYGCFSFNIGKILRTGEGGMVCCHSEEARDRLRLIRVNGMGPHPEGGMEIWRFGSNATLANPLAAIGVIQLSRFQKISERRSEIFTRFLDGIAGLPIKLACGRSGLEPAYYSCAMRLDQEWVTHRKALLESLAYDRAPIGAGNKKLLHHLPFLAEKARPTDCPVAEALHPTMLYFDPVQTLSDHAVDATVESLRRAFNRVKL